MENERELRTTYIIDDLGKYHCEKCGFIAEIDGMIVDWNYCPKCGAVIDSWQEN